MDWNDFSMEVVIPSKNRPNYAKHMCKLIPDPIVCVEDIEEKKYRRALGEDARILTHPKFDYLYEIRDWIVKNVKSDVIWMCDDDSKRFTCIVGRRQRVLDPEQLERSFRLVAANAGEAGTSVFGISSFDDSRRFNPTRPIGIAGHVAGWCFGVWREKFNKYIGFDPKAETQQDYAISLKALMIHRFIWIDNRFGVLNVKEYGVASGGVGDKRVFHEERRERGIKHLVNLYGEDYVFIKRNSQGGLICKIQVPRIPNWKKRLNTNAGG